MRTVTFISILTGLFVIGLVLIVTGKFSEPEDTSEASFANLHERLVAENAYQRSEQREARTATSTETDDPILETNGEQGSQVTIDDEVYAPLIIVNSVPEQTTTETYFALPTIKTISARSIEATSAELRGEVNMKSYKNGRVFVVYGYKERAVSDVMRSYRSYADIPTLTTDEVRVYQIDSRANNQEQYRRRFSRLAPETTYFYSYCLEYKNIIDNTIVKCGEITSFNTTNSTRTTFYQPRASVSRATDITEDTAIISGTITMNSGVDGVGFFVYGTDEDVIDEISNTYDTYRAVREDDEALQKVRVAAELRGRGTYQRLIDELDRDTEYFYRLCAEYTGDEDGLICSSARSFTTKNRTRDDLPLATITTHSIDYDTVTIRGTANMGDFINGKIFFVYGTDDSRIAKLGGEGSFARLSQRGDQIQKILVDDDLDGNGAYSYTLEDLQADTLYSYRLCVEYEDENDYNRDTAYLSCSLIADFVASNPA